LCHSIPRIAAFVASTIRLLATRAEPAPGRNRDRDAHRANPNDIAGDADIPQAYAPSSTNAGRLCVLDHIACDGCIRLDVNPDAAVVAVLLSFAVSHEVADHVALANGKPSAVIDIGDRHADGGAIDDVVCDHRAFKGELRVESHFAGCGG
jgi:hypothetical protein